TKRRLREQKTFRRSPSTFFLVRFFCVRYKKNEHTKTAGYTLKAKKVKLTKNKTFTIMPFSKS
ncbi:MAG TPA: hypothetical protein PK467_10230, partial [Candidatus Wallbacteria bacterium]|nr:hypothetical protein [Candidatus Wallbacteria bacterium]